MPTTTRLATWTDLSRAAQNLWERSMRAGDDDIVELPEFVIRASWFVSCDGERCEQEYRCRLLREVSNMMWELETERHGRPVTVTVYGQNLRVSRGLIPSGDYVAYGSDVVRVHCAA